MGSGLPLLPAFPPAASPDQEEAAAKAALLGLGVVAGAAGGWLWQGTAFRVAVDAEGVALVVTR